MSHIRWRPNEAGLRQLLESPDGDVANAVRVILDNTARIARSIVPVDSGRLRHSISTRMEYSRRAVRGYVYVKPEYGIYVHEGTGIYGPRGAPIEPKRGKYLVFTPKGSSQPVFARQVRGQRPQRFLLRALQTASPWPVDDSVRWRR